MKSLKKFFCLLLMIVLIVPIVACSKNKSNGDDKNKTDIEQKDDGKKDDNKEEEYVPLKAGDIVFLGAKLSEKFFNDFSVNLTDDDKFDDNIEQNKEMFLNASQMLKNIKEFKDIPYDRSVKGEVLSQENLEKPNMVDKFYIVFTPEDESGNSSVEIKIILSYKDSDVDYKYDYYYFLIETNNKQKTISFECSVENSYALGTNNSKASYSIFEFDGVIGDNEKIDNFCVSCFERNTKITNIMVNPNFIDNFEQSKFSNQTKSYSDPARSKDILGNSESEQVLYLTEKIGNLEQGHNMLNLSRTTKSITNLSESIVPYVIRKEIKENS